MHADASALTTGTITIGKAHADYSDTKKQQNEFDPRSFDKPSIASHDALIKELVSQQDTTRNLISDLFGQVSSYVVDGSLETAPGFARQPAVETPLGSALNALVEVQYSLNAELRSLIARIAP